MRLPEATIKGRGTARNPDPRFERYTRAACDDGWARQEAPDDGAVTTTVETDASRTVIARNTSPDLPFDRSVNPYRGCEHGCVYCYARPSHAYLGLSPGLDFETRLFAKRDAARLLERALAHPRYRPRPLMLGANTDPYQPIERRFRITRAVLEVLLRFRHPVMITTKSALVLRDLDLLEELARRRLVSVALSVTTLDPALARTMEPRAAAPGRRLEAIAALGAAAVPTSVMAAPIIPGLNDHELDAILAAAAAAGAGGAGYTLLRLPLELKGLFEDWLTTHRPERASRVLARLRDCHGGEIYAADFRTRMTGTGAYAALIGQRFTLACRRLGFDARGRGAFALDTTRFRVPPQGGDRRTCDEPTGEQLRLL